jgi:hypothetical protein
MKPSHLADPSDRRNSFRNNTKMVEDIAVRAIAVFDFTDFFNFLPEWAEECLESGVRGLGTSSSLENESSLEIKQFRDMPRLNKQ